jgi:hypothetical protein
MLLWVLERQRATRLVTFATIIALISDKDFQHTGRQINGWT